MAKPKAVEADGDKPKTFIHPLTHHIWTDGSFRPPDNASCAYLIFSQKSKHVVAMKRFAYRGKTINQMELQAINHALDHPGMDYVVIYSDSAYSISCLTLWHKSWERNNWMNPLGEPIKNKELIQEILAKIKTKKFVRFIKVKAHSGDEYNSAVDYMVQDLSALMRDDPKIPNGAYPV
jgi:ribonuclease HI